jgi:hypothetical protein
VRLGFGKSSQLQIERAQISVRATILGLQRESLLQNEDSIERLPSRVQILRHCCQQLSVFGVKGYGLTPGGDSILIATASALSQRQKLVVVGRKWINGNRLACQVDGQFRLLQFDRSTSGKSQGRVIMRMQLEAVLQWR